MVLNTHILFLICLVLWSWICFSVRLFDHLRAFLYDAFLLGTDFFDFDYYFIAPFLSALVMFLFAFNFGGMIDIISQTSVFVFMFTLSWYFLILIGWITFDRMGLRFTVIYLFVAGSFTAMLPFYVLEVVSGLFRTISLSFRLFANILAGHLILHLVWAITISSFHDFAILAVLGSSAVLFGIVCLELAMGMIQIYVFLMLTTVYLTES